MASGLLAGAVVAVLGACGLIWWYRQAAFGWKRAEPQVLATARAGRDRPRDGRAGAGRGRPRCAAPARPAGSGAITWAVLAAAVLIAAPVVVGHQAPKGRHAVVVAVDAATGDVRWRVTTPGWSLRALAVTGDVVTHADRRRRHRAVP